MAKKQKQTNKDYKDHKNYNGYNLLRKLRIYLLPIILFIILLTLILLTYQAFMADKFYPSTYVGDVNVSFLTEGQAIRKVQAKFNQRRQQQLQFTFGEKQFNIDLAATSANLDYSFFAAILETTHKKSFWNNLEEQIMSLIFGTNNYPIVSLSLDKQLTDIASSVEKLPQDAKLEFNETVEGSPSAQIQTKEGVDGISLDKEAVGKEITNFLLTGDRLNLSLPVKVTEPKITTFHVQRAKMALENTVDNPIKLVFEDYNWTIDTKQLLTLLDLTSGEDLLLDKDKTYFYLGKVALEIDQEVQEGLFEFNPQSKKVTAFKPSQDGRKLDIEKSYQLISDSLTSQGSKTIMLPVDIVKPKIQTSDVNSLGIKELLGRGISNFAGSIPNRIYNINLTAQKINGVLIPPGEIFSFNQTVGDISAATGFKQAYVIKEGRTVLDDGGGVCQDSTTLFRAVLNAGLPVVKRTAHAYRVSYYEQGFPPGLDATVFYPSVDFQFKNDTSHHILVQSYTSGLTLYVDLYGTSDGRATSLTRPIVSNQTPPPAELRQDDPTLPRGTVKQVDWPAWGATVTFSRTVTRGGETLTKETFKSNYKAWQAVYLVGTKD